MGQGRGRLGDTASPLASMISRRQMLRLAGGAAGVGLLAACSSSKSASGSTGSAGSSSTASTAGSIPTSPINFAFVLPTTGALAAAYSPTFGPLKLAVKEINASGGILGRQINTKSYDDQGQAADETTAAESVLSDGVDFIFGPVGTSNYLASIAITQSGSGKAIQTGASEDQTLVNPAKYPGSFINGRKIDKDAHAYVDFIVGKQGAKRVGILLENTGYGTGGRDFTIAELKTHGLTPVGMEIYDELTPSLAPQILRLKEAKPDALIIWSSPPADNLHIITAMQDADLVPMTMMSSAFATTLAKALPPDRVTKELFSQLFSVTLRSMSYSSTAPLSSNFLAKTEAVFTTYGIADAVKPAVATQMTYYDYVYALKAAIEKAHSFEFGPVAKALEQTSALPGVMGPMTFTASDHTGYGSDQYQTVQITDLSDPMAQGYLGQAV